MPNLRQLEYLVAVADAGNFRRAAELAGTTQPTLSEQLKALEIRLGAQLVERSRVRVVITPLGEQVVSVARRMLADSNEITRLAASGGRELSGVLRLGLPATVGPYLLPHVVPELHRRYPDLRLYVREELPSDLPALLESGKQDAIISLLPLRNASLVVQPLFREPLHLVVAADHPLAREHIVSGSDLAGQDVLTVGAGHQLHDVVQGLCTEFGARLRREYEGTSLDMLLEMVALGLGISFLPGLYTRAATTSDESIRVIPLENRAIYRSICIAWRKASLQQDSYKALAELVREQILNRFDDFTLVS
ncbi:MAG: LysR family transcriptional regulator [Hyphomicrobiales bacterium]|nr:LysR family transcriptional regulator [Hyphomicrobiales bacterium]